MALTTSVCSANQEVHSEEPCAKWGTTLVKRPPRRLTRDGAMVGRMSGSSLEDVWDSQLRPTVRWCGAPHHHNVHCPPTRWP